MRVLARRPDYWNKEEVWSREELKEITRNLAVLSEPAVCEVYQRAYHQLPHVSTGPCNPGAGSGKEAVKEVAQVEPKLGVVGDGLW
jgi:hypothetical protein